MSGGIGRSLVDPGGPRWKRKPLRKRSATTAGRGSHAPRPPGGGEEMNTMGTPPQGGSWLRQWFGGNGPGSAEALQALLSQILQQETALACHLAERARALRFGPHRLSLEVVAERDRQNARTLAREIG